MYSKYKPEITYRYSSLFKEKLKDFLMAVNRPQIKTLRTNTIKTTSKELLSSLTEQGFVLDPVSWCKEGFFISKEPFPISTTIEYLQGHFFIQDAASMAVAPELDPRPDELVLDMASAPGGKTTHLAQLMNNKGTILALDSEKERLEAVKNNLERCGVFNVIVMNMDANDIKDLNLQFDKILLDAPCSGEGVVRRDPKRILSLSLKDYEKFSSIQKSLLKSAAAVLKKGGTLLYSTCSMAPEENELQVEYAVENLDLKVVPLSNKELLPGLSHFFGQDHPDYLEKCGRFYPHTHNTQGFFLAKLEKC